MAMGLIRLVREHTDFPIHKYAAHVIRKVSHHPVTGVWRAEGWKTGEQHRFRLQIRRVLGTNVDINRLFERLQPARWTGDDIADAFWTFFLRNVYGATAFPDVVDVKRELLVKKTTLAQQAGARSASATGARGKNTEPYVLSDVFFHRRGLSRDAFVRALEACVKHPDTTFPGWLAAAGWDDVTTGPRDPAEYLLPEDPPPSREPPSKEPPLKETGDTKIVRHVGRGKKRGRGDGATHAGEVSETDGASGATDATRVSARVARRGKIKTVDKNGRRSLGSLADDDDDDDDDARSAPGRRARPDDTPTVTSDGTRNGAGKGTRTAADEDGQSRRRFVVAAASLAAATQLGDVESVAAALKTLVTHASPTTALAAFDAATDVGDRYFASLAADVFAEYNRDLMADGTELTCTESVFDDDASVFDEGEVTTSRVRTLEAPPVEDAGIERLCSIPEDAETDLLGDLLAASPRY